MLKDFLNQKLEYSMGTGRKIYRIRKRRNIGIKYLADVCNVTESAVRYYESGTRQINEERLLSIANALHVDPAALKEHNIDTLNDVVHILFDLERAELLFPKFFEKDSEYGFYTRNLHLCEVIRNWISTKQACGAEDSESESFERWKDSYPDEYKSFIDDPDLLFPLDPEYSFLYEGDTREIVTHYPYYTLVILLRIRQMLDRNKAEVDDKMEKYLPEDVFHTYQHQQLDLVNLLEGEIRKLVNEAQIRSRTPLQKLDKDGTQSNK